MASDVHLRHFCFTPAIVMAYLEHVVAAPVGMMINAIKHKHAAMIRIANTTLGFWSIVVR
jgi:hypothetical protein